ncbi:MAG: isocitrate/isopropylmalate dehydrogenase family protein [Candidatus Heimdallarchaeota archaeon]|nr:MAG: isocitrate/isopropylmalate dehydrogenase family protein [Candidatus Gerdarchaeota archaeon]RLI73612.1 MAG: isocitrate/isopropylmalate dehydrogenase family protein [Candidatus Heimdallarchaeota archaeon]
MTKKYKIAFMPGDGIGNDVLEAARMVIEEGTDFQAEFIHGDIGWVFWEKEGDALPARTVEMMKETDAALFGAITSKPNVKGYRSPIVRLRQIFNLYSNMRPCKAYEGNPLNYRDDIDLVVFRENTEGLYSGVEFYDLKELQNIGVFKKYDINKTTVSCRIFTEEGCRRIIRRGFEYAQKKGYPTVTLVHKANVIRATDGMFLRIAEEVAKDFPKIEVWKQNIDAMCMQLVKNPQKFGVIVTTNMFGDIVSDLTAQLVGGLGFAASASTSDSYGLFEPTHGSAPKYAGQYKVNPIAAILSVKLMFEWLGENKLAEAVENAVKRNIKEGKVKTYDLGGTSSTLDVAKDIVRILNE